MSEEYTVNHHDVERAISFIKKAKFYLSLMEKEQKNIDPFFTGGADEPSDMSMLPFLAKEVLNEALAAIEGPKF